MAQYYFDERSIERIGDAVRKIEKMGGDRNQPADYQTPIATPFRTIIRGNFEGEWAKDAKKTVSFTADNGDEKTKDDVVNDFQTVGKSNSKTNCIIGLVGTEWVLIGAELASECVEVSTIEESGNLTLLSQINPTGSVVTAISGFSGPVVTGLSGSVVTDVRCVDGNIVVTTASLGNLATFTPLSNLASTASLADMIGYTEKTVRLSDLATVTTQNIAVPTSEGCN